MNKSILSKIFISVAGLSLVFAIICFCMPIGGLEEHVKYGGDAYTGIQNASATTANNIVLLNKIIKNIGGFFFLTISSLLGGIGVTLGYKETSSSNVSVNPEKEELLRKQKIVSALKVAATIQSSTKRCPHCGENISSNICDMCGKKNNLFD